MKRKKKTNRRAEKKNISLTTQRSLPQSDAALRNTSPARGEERSPSGRNTMQETVLPTEASLQSISPKAIAQMRKSQVPEMPRCRRIDLDPCPQVPLAQLIAPHGCEDCKVLQEKAAGNFIQTPAAEQASSICPEGNCGMKPLQVTSPEPKEGEPGQQNTPDTPVFKASQAPMSPEDLDGDKRDCQGRLLPDSCLVLAEVWPSNAEDAISSGCEQINDVWGPSDVQGEPKTETSGCSAGISVTQSQINGKADPPQGAVLQPGDPPLPELTFQSPLEIFQVMKKERRGERAASQLEKPDSQLQEDDIKSQPHRETSPQQRTGLPDDVTPATMLPPLGCGSEHNTSQLTQPCDASHLNARGPELKSDEPRFRDQDRPAAREAMLTPETRSVLMEGEDSQCAVEEVQGEDAQCALEVVQGEDAQCALEVVQGEDPPGQQPSSVLGDQNQVKGCPLNAQTPNFLRLEVQTSKLVAQGASGAGFDVPDSQMLGVLDDASNEPNQRIDDITAFKRVVTAHGTEEMTQPLPTVSLPKPCPPSSGPATDEEVKDEDASSTMQGLISELSNLNRLIMAVHRDLRHKRGKIPPGRGAGRKRRRREI